MKQITLLLVTLILILVAAPSNGYPAMDSKKNEERSVYLSLSGQIISDKNQIKANRLVNAPMWHLTFTQSKPNRGTILIFSGIAAELSKPVSENLMLISFLNLLGFDVANLEYSQAINQDVTLVTFLQALKAIRINSGKIGLSGGHFSILGLDSGGEPAARMVQKLGNDEQPENLILVNPSRMDETLPGTVFPIVMPPHRLKGRLLCMFDEEGKREWIRAAQEYTKTWIGYGGQGAFNLTVNETIVNTKGKILSDNNRGLSEVLKAFLETKGKTVSTITNPAAVPVKGDSYDRHAQKLAIVAKEKYDLIMIGNSITNNFEKPEYQAVWKQFFEPRKALNLGYSGYRTENLIWNIQNGELKGQSPKVIVLEIGTNNIDEKNYPTRHTAGQLAGGIKAIVKLLREKCPDSRIIVLRCFPGCYGGPNPTSHRAILERASDLVSKLTDGKHVFYCDVNHVFLNLDGSINHEMMPDWLHPSPEGAKRWAQAMEPLLSKLMGDKSLDNEIPANSAIVPVSKLEEDSYNWWNRHAEILQIKDSLNPEIVLIGNSITHFWGGLPQVRNADGKPRLPNGPKTWASLFGKYRVLNLGFGWDRTQNVLWRLDNGELDGLHPKNVIISIGTNNTSQTVNARINTAEEIVEGIRAVCLRVRSKVPGTKIILMAVFPREQMPDNPRRILINEINHKLEIFAKETGITLLDIGPKILSPDGTISKEILGDFCHPTEKGYQIWADAIRSLISNP